MAYLCPACERGYLRTETVLELPADGNDDEIQLQLLKCASCGFEALGVYRESRHGKLEGNESWHHDGYQVSAGGLNSLRDAIASCPAQKDRRCGCETHAILAKCDWAAITGCGLEVERQFELKLVLADSSRRHSID
jgi:hypothetical protein